MSYKYEYTGDGTHFFPTLGIQPQKGDVVESDEPLHNALLKPVMETAPTPKTKQTIETKGSEE